MIPLSAQSTSALATAADISVRCTLPGAGDDLELQVVDGSLSVDGTAVVSRSAKVTLAPEGYGIPPNDEVWQALYDNGGRLDIDYGVTFPGGDYEWVPLGKFSARKFEVDSRSGLVSVDLMGLGSLIVDDRFAWPQTLAVDSALTRLQALVDTTLPGTTVTLDPSLTDEEADVGSVEYDRMKACQELATALGGDLFEDPYGNFEVRLEHDTIDFDYSDLAVDVKASYDRDQTYNRVKAYSSHPKYGWAWNYATHDDPESPTRWGGPFGRKIKFYSNPNIRNKIRAGRAAERILKTSIGWDVQAKLTVPPHPGIEPFDRVSYRQSDGSIAEGVVEKVALPFLGQGMTLDLKKDTATGTPGVIV